MRAPSPAQGRMADGPAAMRERAKTRRRGRWLRWALATMAVAGLSLAGFGWLHPIQLLEDAGELRLLAAGIHSATVRVDGYPIHYYTGGAGLAGQPVVLVHGLGGFAEQWSDLMIQLVRDHHPVYALDLLGYGESARPADASYSIAEEAGIVEHFLDAVHLQRAELGGWSMGGWVALEVALDEPRRVDRLMLFDSAGMSFQLDWNPALFVPDTPAKLKALNDLLMPGPMKPLPSFLEAAVLLRAREQGWVIRRAMNSMLTGIDIEDQRLRELKMPLLIVWGKQDHIIPLSVGESMHRQVPQSVFESFNGCGHLAPAQCAERIGPKMVGFLDAPPPEKGFAAEY